MPRDHEVYLDDIMEAAGKIEKYTIGMSYEEFRCDGKTIDAVVRNLDSGAKSAWCVVRGAWQGTFANNSADDPMRFIINDEQLQCRNSEI